MPSDKPKKSEKVDAKKPKNTTLPKKSTETTKTTKTDRSSRTTKTGKTSDSSKNKGQKPERKRRDPHKKLDDNEMEAGQIIIKEYIRGKYWSLYLDIYLLFSVAITYGIVLFLTDNLSGILFIIFAIICCLLTSLYSYRDTKQDIGLVLKDLEIMLKGG